MSTLLAVQPWADPAVDANRCDMRVVQRQPLGIADFADVIDRATHGDGQPQIGCMPRDDRSVHCARKDKKAACIGCFDKLRIDAPRRPERGMDI